MHPTSAVRLFAVLAFAGCSGGSAPAAREADASAIRQLYQDWPRSAEAGDAARYVTFLDDSITLLIPGAARVHGVAAYREALVSMFQAATYRVRLDPPTKLEVAGPWAFAHYAGELVTLPRPRGDSSVDRNRYLDILRKQPDGSWRVYIHSFQADAAPPR